MADSLLEEIQDRVRSTGPMPFESFMRLALYHPRHGYYASRVPGQGGDYGTSPSVSPWFGRLVAHELRRMWEALGCPDPFTVIEVGAGRADLAAAALGSPDREHAPLLSCLQWRIVERFEAIRSLQQQRLGPAGAQVEWSPHLGGPPAAAGCILAHEVLDNFPVHLLEARPGGEIQEVYVQVDGSRLVECLGPLSEEALEEPARLAALQISAGTRFEVCADLAGWCRDAGEAIAQGYLLVIDYGDREPDLWRKNPRGTIATYGPEGFGEDPLVDPGGRDVTADVNFSAAARLAERNGFTPQVFATQRDWLRGLGLDGVASGLEASADAAWSRGASADALGIEEDLSLLLTLVAHMGLGDIMVFLAGKNAPMLDHAHLGSL
jgi:SAM-dependent MidA family methyltransferase